VRKRTRIVPSLVVTASFVGVIPACALGACGGTTISSDDAGGDAKGGDAKGDAVTQPDHFLGVAAVAMCCFDASGVADAAFVVDGDASEGG
jgi:hypothetical protein